MQERVFATAEELAWSLCRELVRVASAATAKAPQAIMLAGGRTPLAAYQALKKMQSPGSASPHQRWFLSDERVVSDQSPESNAFHIAPLMAAAGWPDSHFMRVDTRGGAGPAADGFDQDLEQMIATGIRLPLGLLGLGADGHTASLFTADDVENARRSGRWACAVSRPTPPDRVSVTPRLLRKIQRILVVVAGGDKAIVVAQWRQRPLSLAAGLALENHSDVELWMDGPASGG